MLHLFFLSLFLITLAAVCLRGTLTEEEAKNVRQISLGKPGIFS